MRRDRLASFVGALLGALLIAGIVWGGGLSTNGPYVSAVNKVSRSGDTMTGALTVNTAAGAAGLNLLTQQGVMFNSTGSSSGQCRLYFSGASAVSLDSCGFTLSNPTVGTFSSAAQSGTNAFAVNANGARIDFGAGASDYASSDGTTVTFAGPIGVTGNITFDTTRNLTAGGGMALQLVSGVGVAVQGTLTPEANNTRTLGSAALQWSDVRSVLGTFTGAVTTTQLIATSPGNATAIVATSGAYQNTSGVGATGQYLRSGGSGASTTWQTVYANWSADCIGATLTTACSEDGNFTGSVKAISAWTNARVSCSWNTAGTGGTTGVVIQVYDVTAAGEICHCTLGACTTAANVPLACDCAGTYVTGNQYTLRQTGATDCAGDPADFDCNVTYSQ